MLTRFKIVDPKNTIIYGFNNRHKFLTRLKEYKEDGYSIKWLRYQLIAEINKN